MDNIDAFILGIVQGATEFLPVSSTGHLIIVREWFSISESSGLAVDAVLHLATALAVLTYFRKDFFLLLKGCARLFKGDSDAQYKTLFLSLVVGTIPAVVLGLWLEDTIESSVRSVSVVAFALVAGSVLMGIADVIAKGTRASEAISKTKGFLIGCFQALALIPGVSRSGATISGGLILGLSRVEAARFAFMLSFPVIVGAGTLKLILLGREGILGEIGAPLIVGAFAAFLSGFVAIYFLMQYLKTQTFTIFIAYRLVLAAFLLWYL